MAREDDTFNLLERMLFDVTAEPTTDLPLSFLKAITDNFSDDKKIGNGGFAVVYKGLLRNGTVAVKKLSQTLVELDEEKFIKEVGCLMRVKHKNIVRFLGYCAHTQGKVCKHEGKNVMVEERQRLLCFEFLPNGSLDKYITDASRGFEWRTRYHIIKGICQGLDYLHQQKIVHLDLKPSNILLDYYMVPKIADFGISKSFDEKQTRTITSKLLGSLGYMAPETFSGIITFKSDIYCLGIIIIEILTGKKAYPDEMENVLDTWSTRLEVSRVDRQMEHVRVCVEIAIKCIDTNPSKRPLTRRIIEMLDETERAYGSIETDSCTSLVSHQAKGSGDLGKCTHKVPQETSSESSGGEPSEDKFVTWDGTLAMLESSSEWSGNNEVRESPPRPGNSKSNEQGADSKRLRKGSDDEASSTGSRKVRKARRRLNVRTRSAIDVLADGFSWRQCGQKVFKGNPHPRTYYKCAIPGCLVRKHVQRSFRDPSFVITTYENGRHNHYMPVVGGFVL